jgi:GH25 family lysozyme M1 (1,4-beta-N-acetylmuramidase)
MRSSRWWRSWKAVASLASKGIDVSSWQGIIDWDAVKADGIQFAIIRAGFGDELDIKFTRNISECNRVGIPCGVYWFSYALTAQEAAQGGEQGGGAEQSGHGTVS